MVSEINFGFATITEPMPTMIVGGKTEEQWRELVNVELDDLLEGNLPGDEGQVLLDIEIQSNQQNSTNTSELAKAVIERAITFKWGKASEVVSGAPYLSGKKINVGAEGVESTPTDSGGQFNTTRWIIGSSDRSGLTIFADLEAYSAPGQQDRIALVLRGENPVADAVVAS